MKQTKKFPKIYAIGDRHISSIFNEPVEITEKVDGSQFGFGVVNGELICRSKGKELVTSAPEKMFKVGVESAEAFADRLIEGVFYYAEYLQKQKHNIVKYDRVPKGNLALFGMTFNGVFENRHSVLASEAERIGIDVVPLVYLGRIDDPRDIFPLIDHESFLGGAEVEGIVVKNYKEFFVADRLHAVMSGKYVSEKFKEVHSNQWKKLHTGKGKWDVFVDSFKTDARWEKAVQHLRDDGNLEGSPRDIGCLVKEVQRDITAEEKENIKAFLWNNFGRQVLRNSVHGLPEWYKRKLVETGG